MALAADLRSTAAQTGKRTAARLAAATISGRGIRRGTGSRGDSAGWRIRGAPLPRSRCRRRRGSRRQRNHGLGRRTRAGIIAGGRSTRRPGAYRCRCRRRRSPRRQRNSWLGRRTRAGIIAGGRSTRRAGASRRGAGLPVERKMHHSHRKEEYQSRGPDLFDEFHKMIWFELCERKRCHGIAVFGHDKT
jgi:hypothetical protein